MHGGINIAAAYTKGNSNIEISIHLYIGNVYEVRRKGNVHIRHRIAVILCAF